MTEAEVLAALGVAIAKGDAAAARRLAEQWERMKAPSERKPLSGADIIAAWRAEGPLVHVPTGLPTLDRLTGGGPVFGSRVYVLGAPDAGKTALVVQWADELRAQGVAVGLHLVDEDPSDTWTRVFQRRGFTRADCERRAPATLDRMAGVVAELGLRTYDGTWTIEAAAADLAAYAAEQGQRAAFFSDSLQTVTSDEEADADSLRAAVTARVRAYRAAATKHRMLVVATSEMGRHAYRSVEAAENADDMASAKESGAVEYSARVLLALRSAKGSPDLLELRIAKNKHGPSGERIALRIDRDAQQITETDEPLPEQADRSATREAARTSREHGRNLAAAVALVGVLLAEQGLSSRAVAPRLRAVLGSCSAPLADAAVAVLGAAVYRVEGPNRRQALYLNPRELPEAVYARLAAPVRRAVDELTHREEARDAAE